jgi:hypothetical protein
MPVYQPQHARRARRYVAVTAACATATVAAGLPFAVAYAATPTAPPGPPPAPAAQPQAVRASLLPDRRAAPAASPGQYLVRKGDTLSGIAADFCASAADYRALAVNNRIADANLIYPGELVKIACRAALAALAPAAAPPDPRAATLASAGDPPARVTAAGGTLGCAGLQALWDAAGGNSADSFMAAEIAMAESGGRQYALSPTGDVGYFQINLAAHGPELATYNAYGNARAAVLISDDGTDWSPWTTYRENLYEGRC